MYRFHKKSISSLAPTAAAPPFRFFDLPVEIRRMIYEYIGILRTSSYDPKPKYKYREYYGCVPPGRQLGINKAFARELSLLVYGERKFRFRSLFESITFLKFIGPQNASHIHHIRAGSLWSNAKEAIALKPSYKIQLPAFFKYIADTCPDLQYLQVGGMIPVKSVERRHSYYHIWGSTKGEEKEWKAADLELVKSLTEAFPKLTEVSYQVTFGNLALAIPGAASQTVDGVAPFKTEDKFKGYVMVPRKEEFKPFDVEKELNKRKQATKGRRSAAGKVACAAMCAKKAARVWLVTVALRLSLDPESTDSWHSSIELGRLSLKYYRFKTCRDGVTHRR